MIRMLAVVDWHPLVPSPQPIALAVVVAEGVVVFDAVLEHELSTL